MELFPSVFMPLCAPALLDAARIALADPGGASDVPLLGRPDWWALWHRTRGSAQTPPPGSFGTTFSAEYLDIAAAVAGHGIAIGSPILFRAELDARRLVPVHDFAASGLPVRWAGTGVARSCSSASGCATRQRSRGAALPSEAGIRSSLISTTYCSCFSTQPGKSCMKRRQGSGATDVSAFETPEKTVTN